MKTLITSIKIFIFFTILTGIIYPLLITLLGQLIFPFQANGSLIVINGKTIGSKLIAQNSDTSIYFSSRPSMISYNPMPSGASNYGLTNSRLKDTVNYRKKKFLLYNHLGSLTPVPAEMLFASASGIDPHISPEAAFLQVERIASARKFNVDQKNQLMKIIRDNTEKPQFGLLGESRVNALLLNLEIDKIK